MIQSTSKISEILLEIGAVKINFNPPYKWASGWDSPVYCDNRIILSYPEKRDFVANLFVETIKKHYPSVEYIAGVATGGIGIGALIAQKMSLPMVYVRGEAKKHGQKNMIEGFISPKKKAVVIEDLISTGKSSLEAVKILRNSDIDILGLVSIFNYGFLEAKQSFEKADCPFVSLDSFETLSKFLLEKNKLSTDEIAEIDIWKKDPSKWRK